MEDLQELSTGGGQILISLTTLGFSCCAQKLSYHCFWTVCIVSIFKWCPTWVQERKVWQPSMDLPEVLHKGCGGFEARGWHGTTHQWEPGELDKDIVEFRVRISMRYKQVCHCPPVHSQPGYWDRHNSRNEPLLLFHYFIQNEQVSSERDRAGSTW